MRSTPVHVSRSFATVLALALSCLACSGGAPAFPTSTSAALVGAACGTPGRPCRCVGDGEPLGDVPAGKKRYEVRLPQVSESDSAVQIAGVGTVLRTSGAQGDQCFYVDLDAGQTYAVTVHGRAARRERGLALGYSIREYDPRSAKFYVIVDQLCGDATAACPHDDPADWVLEYQNGRGHWDPCSSTRLERLHANGGFFDRHMTDAQITFDLRVYRFVPDHRPGDEGCPGPS